MAVHGALIVDAVLETEHVGDLVDHCATGSLEPDLALSFGSQLSSWVFKGHLVSAKREDASAAVEVGQAKHVVPGIIRVEILVCDPKDAEGVPCLVFE